MKNNLLIPAVFLLTLLLSGCQSTTTYYLGAQAAQKGVVSLAANHAEDQRWEDLYATVDYSFDRRRNQLDFEGIFSFSSLPQINYERVRDFKLKLFLLDENRIVVDYLEVVRTLSGDLEKKISFSYHAELAKSVTALTFGYDGSFADPGETYSVWEYPKRNF